MSSIKILQLIKNITPTRLLRVSLTRFQRRLQTIYIHDSVQIFGSGDLEIRDGVHIDEGVVIYIPKGAKLVLAENCRIGRYCHIELCLNDLIIIGPNTSIQARVHLHGSVEIGSSTLIAPNCFLSSGTHNFSGEFSKTIIQKDNESQRGGRKVVVGSDCWLGINSVILPGSSIGDKCVIGANVVFNGELGGCKIVKPASPRVIESINYQ